MGAPRAETASVRVTAGGDHDAEPLTVRLVRPAHGPAYLVAIHTAHPWVLRRRYLVPEDLD